VYLAAALFNTETRK